MSHSTTTTSTYLLQKYSKSYPKTGTQSNIQSSEWQHFTNAIIRLALDIKKAEDGQLESVRLRILWSMNPTDDGSDQNDVVFEDLDLLSFSSPSMQGKSKRPIQGLPLKAVYRDSVVGIRYLHSRVSTNPTYRRFQITFNSTTDTQRFIHSIQTVCPCKANSGDTPAPVPGHPTVQNPGTPDSTLSRMSSGFVPPSRDFTFRAPTPVDSGPETSGKFPSPLIRTATIAPQPASLNHLVPSSVPQLRTEETSPHRLRSSEIPHCQSAPQQSDVPTLSRPLDAAPQSSLPCSSPLLSSGQRTSTSSDTRTDASQRLEQDTLLSLRQLSGLSSLSSTALEQCVREVIMEDSFPKLMESLASMWRLKGFLGNEEHYPHHTASEAV